MKNNEEHHRFLLTRHALSLVGVAISLVTASTFLGRLWWPFEVISHFRWQYALLSTFWAVLLALTGNRFTAAITALAAVLNMAVLLPFYTGRPLTESGEASLRIVSANVLKTNKQPDLLERWLAEVEPDLLILVEATPDYLAGLEQIDATYPYQQRGLKTNGIGIAIFSRRPLQLREALLGEKAPILMFDLEASGPLTVIAAHPPAPRGAERLRLRTKEMEAVARLVEAQAGEVVVVGDLNSTSWSPYFRDFLRETGLREGRLGFGLQNSWPVQQPLLRIPIDHVLVSQGLAVHRFETGPSAGSDHFPILVDLSFRE